ncbi:MAG: fibronectin type III domain-containing protein [Solirubrobacteraceae bacterium]
MRIPRPIATALVAVAVLVGAVTLTAATALAAFQKPVTEPATAITGNTALLHGKLNPEFPAKTNWLFDYGTEGSCTVGASQTVFEAPTEGITTNEARQSEVTGLIPHEIYTFCIAAVGFGPEGLEQTPGNPLTFETPGEAPVVEGLSASALKPTTATLEAQVNPEAESVPTCEFEYGKTAAANEFSAPCEQALPLEGHEPQHVSAAISELQVGTKYHYRLLVHNGTGAPTPTPEGEFSTVGQPTVTTGAAQSPTRTTIVLFGAVNPEGAQSTYQWEYISQAGYEAAIAESAANPYAEGNSTAPLRTTASFEPQSLGPIIAGELRPETTYHYALVASNEAGFTIGEDATFTTGTSTPPIVTTTGATVNGPNSATITGTLSTRGLQSSYGFQIGVEAGVYGPATGLGSIPAGAEGASVSYTLLNLVPGTTYHYRLVGTNEDGVQNGADQTFTIPAVTSPLSLPLVSPQIGSPAIAFPTVAANSGSAAKTPTKAQRLAKALKACKKKPKRLRAGCERRARKQYGRKAKKAASHAATAHAARTISLNETGRLHLTSHHSFTLNEMGSASGTITGTIYIHLHVVSTNHVTAEISIYPRGGSITGSASASYHPAGAFATFSGTMAVTRGTGSYSHAHGSGLSFSGTIQRSNDAVTVHVNGRITA